jgi:hypothetical protein
MMTTVDDALDGLPARDLERLKERIERRLRACVIDGQDGAIACRVSAKLGASRSDVRFTLLLCPACIEAHRLPEGRADAVTPA